MSHRPFLLTRSTFSVSLPSVALVACIACHSWIVQVFEIPYCNYVNISIVVNNLYDESARVNGCNVAIENFYFLADTTNCNHLWMCDYSKTWRSHIPKWFMKKENVNAWLESSIPHWEWHWECSNEHSSLLFLLGTVFSIKLPLIFVDEYYCEWICQLRGLLQWHCSNDYFYHCFQNYATDKISRQRGLGMTFLTSRSTCRLTCDVANSHGFVWGYYR